MLFNSLSFVVFFPIVTVLYFLCPGKWRWALLLAASCYFYMSFVPVYILILGATILVDYWAAIWMEKSEGPKRKQILWISIGVTCLILFVFKYFNFFNSNMAALAEFLHWNYSVEALQLILPIGLSFHTFQSLSYVIEVYWGKQRAERHFGIYSLYVMFYPQLVAGPIERPQNLLHQLRERHRFEYQRVTDGLKLMAWGMFKKVVIADRLKEYVDIVYANPAGHDGVNFIVATVFFAFQIFCDFSGYSDIAIGSAQVMGIRLRQNFNRPYAAPSVGEFWRRWHMSLMSWFRDYVYIPLGGSRVSVPRWCWNIFIVFLMSGLWHGANWTFIIWGALNGLYVVLGTLTKKWRDQWTRAIGLAARPRIHRVIQIAVTFVLICFSWIFFRAQSLPDALYIVRHLFSGVGDLCLKIVTQMQSVNSGQGLLSGLLLKFDKMEFLFMIALIVGMEWIQYIQEHSARPVLAHKPVWVRWTVYYGLIIGILLFGVFNQENQFIYFQF
jgi:alginate O-acetyltransferase complex protein AlgI